MQKLQGFEDYKALFLRCKWWAVVSFVVAAAAAILLSTMVPKIYVSETLLQVQPREVPEDFVKDLISGSTDERLTAIEQAILSRTNLMRIVDQYGDRMRGYERLNVEQKAAKLRSRIQIDPVLQKVGGRTVPVANVKISCRDRDPEIAQKIASRLASLFVEQENRARESQVFGTTEFLTSELAKISEQLRESEDKLKALKERYRYELPSELETNLRTLDRLQIQRTANTEALDRYMTMRLNLEQQLLETPQRIPRSAAPAGSIAAVEPARNPAVEAFRKKEQELQDLLGKVTDKHPDVQRLRSELEQLRKDITDEELAEADKPRPARQVEVTDEVPNPAYQNLVAQLNQVKTEIEIRKRERENIEAEMAKYNQRVQDTPRIEQEMAAILRTNEDLNKQHDDLKAKLAQAKLAESLESRQKGTQFIVIDPANYPLAPANASQAALILGGLAAALGFGMAVVYGVGRFDPRVWTRSELDRLTGCATLAEIPTVPTAEINRREQQKKLLYAGSLAISLAVYLGAIYHIYASRPTFLRHLEPVLEKIAERMVR